MNGMLTAALCFLVALVPLTVAKADDAAAPARRPKKIYAHYMACYPAASAAPAWERNVDGPKIRHDGTGRLDPFGGQWRNWPLVPQGMQLSLEDTMDLEIRRAMRAGINGFVVDMANEKYWYDVITAMFKVAQEKKYPFEISVCLDNVPDRAKQIKWLIDTYHDSPNLARRDGKPFIAGYYSALQLTDVAGAAMIKRDGLKGVTPAAMADDPRLRATPEGWQDIANAFRDLEQRVGTPIYWHFCLEGFFVRIDPQYVKPGMIVKAAELFAKNGMAVGAFLGFPEQDAAARAVKAAGGEWAAPMWYQYENAFNGFNQKTKGFEMLRNCWEKARKFDSTVIQFVTWNDYTENTNLAPAYQTRYTILDLNSYFIQWWRDGAPPKVDTDRIYLSYPPYAAGARTFPFKSRDYSRTHEGVLEVVTILTKPATVRLPERGIEYDAPAGFFSKQFPAPAGPVNVDLVRDGTVSTQLRAPEPITDRPYREQTSMVCYSTEEERNWKIDFPGVKPFFPSDYGDDDADGLPNWFEMYWFGRPLDYTTSTVADPKADPDGDGRSNLQEYLDQTDPTKPDKPQR